MAQTITDRKGITVEVLRTKQYKEPDNTMYYVKRPRGKRTYCVWQYANGVMTEATAWGWVNFQVINAANQCVLETWPTLAGAQQACSEICQRWGKGEAFVKQT